MEIKITMEQFFALSNYADLFAKCVFDLKQLNQTGMIDVPDPKEVR
ncbi:MAG: hypothetical protein ACLQMF_20560 [Rectinemataceae bacterium]